MIVKVIIRKNPREVSVWDKDDNRLYHSDIEKDVVDAEALLINHEYKTVKGIRPTEIKSAYFNAYWLKKVIQLTKIATGYNW